MSPARQGQRRPGETHGDQGNTADCEHRYENGAGQQCQRAAVVVGGRRLRVRAIGLCRLRLRRLLILIERKRRPEGLQPRLMLALWLAACERRRSPQRHGTGQEQPDNDKPKAPPFYRTATNLIIPSRSQRQYPFYRSRRSMIIRAGCVCKRHFFAPFCSPGGRNSPVSV